MDDNALDKESKKAILFREMRVIEENGDFLDLE